MTATTAGDGSRVVADLHFEPFVHLAGLDDDQALLAWGGFWFRPFEDGRGWRIVDDEELSDVEPGRNESIGARSMPYGHAVVEVFGPDGELAAHAETDDANHAWVRGLRPATEYRYEIAVGGRPWVPEECLCWQRLDEQRGELRPSGRTYDCRFRTFPAPGDVESVRFAALGDYGVGIQTGDDHGRYQERIASVLERLVDDGAIDLIVTLGDNIYHEEGSSIGGSGAEDDDWYFSYYEPYRHVISRVPVYPAIGNHDAGDTEATDDRGQMADNHFTDVRFSSDVEDDRDAVAVEDGRTAGLFYRFSYGRLVEFVCIDTSEAAGFDADRYFDDAEHQAFLDDAFDPDRADRGRWLIPYSHHPAYCAGPSHDNDHAQIRSLLPRYRRSGVRVVLAGHEHNFQHSVDGDMHLLVCGAGGKLRPERPDRFADARTVSWSAEPHVLLVEADADQLTLLPVGGLDADGTPVPIRVETPDGAPVEPSIVVHR